MYPNIFKNLQNIVTYITNKFNLNQHTPKKGRSLKISNNDAVTFALYQHQSTRATKISLYRDFKEALNCSYKTLVVNMNNMGYRALLILSIFMRIGRKDQHLVKYTDATDIPVCLKKNADSNRVMRGLAAMSKSSKGYYYGLKMTMTRDADGRILNLKFSPANANDRELFCQINKDIWGIIVADAGYISKKLEKAMNVEGKRWVLIRPKKNMKKLATPWQLALYKKRFDIEFDFRDIKLFHGLVTSLPRSVNGMISNYIYALLSFVLKPKDSKNSLLPCVC